MGAYSYLNGNRTKGEKKQWLYADGKPVRKNGKIEYRLCPKCDKLPTKEGHDACLGTLPGVTNACCGHGVKFGYVSFENGTVLRFGKYSLTAETVKEEEDKEVL